MKPFLCAKHEELVRMLEEFKIDGKDLRMLRNLHGELGDKIDIQKVVRQGCILSHYLFNL